MPMLTEQTAGIHTQDVGGRAAPDVEREVLDERVPDERNPRGLVAVDVALWKGVPVATSIHPRLGGDEGRENLIWGDRHGSLPSAEHCWLWDL
jgi:hypothetical protein